MKNKLHLSETDQKVAGVFGGMAEYYHVDATILRLVFIVLALITAVVPAVLFYFVAWVIIPEYGEHGQVSPTQHA